MRHSASRIYRKFPVFGDHWVFDMLLLKPTDHGRMPFKQQITSQNIDRTISLNQNLHKKETSTIALSNNTILPMWDFKRPQEVITPQTWKLCAASGSFGFLSGWTNLAWNHKTILHTLTPEQNCTCPWLHIPRWKKKVSGDTVALSRRFQCSLCIHVRKFFNNRIIL